MNILKSRNLNSSVILLQFFALSAHLALWLLRSRVVYFNPIIIYLGLIVLIVNFTLTFFYNQKDEIIGHIFGFSAFAVQILLLILLVKSGQII